MIQMGLRMFEKLKFTLQTFIAFETSDFLQMFYVIDKTEVIFAFVLHSFTLGFTQIDVHRRFQLGIWK